MRVVVISCVFPPEPVVSSRTSADIVRELVARGHQVTVFAPFPNRPGARVYPGYSRRLFKRMGNESAPLVVRCFSTLSRNGGFISRFFENLTFGFTSAIGVLLAPRPDVIYSNTWPIIASGIIAAIARLRSVPVVTSVQDLYPESLVYQGRLGPNALVTRLLRWADGAIAGRSRALIVISDYFAAVYQGDRHVPSERVNTIPNWGDNGPFCAAGNRRDLREERGLTQDAFIAVYSGSIGAAAGVELVIEAMAQLRDLAHVYLLVAGVGSRLEACKALANTLGVTRALFHTPYPKEDTARVLATADLLLLPTYGQQALASMPSKVVDYMLSGRPILAVADPKSDLARLIGQSGCGWIVPPGRPDLLASKLRDLVSAGGAELVRRGQLGQDYALRHLTKEVCLPRVIAVLEAAGEARQR